MEHKFIKRNVLVTDDCEETLRCLKTVIEVLGHDVFTLQNKFEALKRLEEFDPDLVITDLASPGLGGIDFIQALKKIDSSIPVIVLSGNITLGSARAAIRLGVFDCFDKPFDVIPFQRAIGQAMKSGRMG